MNLKENERFIEMVQRGAELRNDEFVSAKYVKKALELIEKKEVEVEKNSTGAPSLLGTYKIAFKLYKNA